MPTKSKKEAATVLKRTNAHNDSLTVRLTEVGQRRELKLRAAELGVTMQTLISLAIAGLLAAPPETVVKMLGNGAAQAAPARPAKRGRKPKTKPAAAPDASGAEA